ncbi:ankyrin repeat and LEM domain-containing protein 2-like, partial [Amphibalanus amphitrite]|uniref:ankyrin repeat and LEM domain-containing protein 2-like n=1 Tax=Amphibalanus amphitrite TaxID=1232801 RepID=UPI001C920D01
MSEDTVNSNGPRMPTTFYGINLRLAEGLQRPDGVPLYCTSIQEVQAVMKANKTARFKSFSSQAEAEAFSRLAADPGEGAAPPAAPSPSAAAAATGAGGEKPSPYKNPSRPDFQEFRKLVESGDERGVVAAVARNPRYLISSGDTPALLREGPRHNSLHLAALRGRDAVCRTLLELVGDPRLFQRLYPDDAPEVAAGRSEYMLDLYLNMPTKGTFETPLHLAAKQGHLETVRALVQHPACKRDLTNKFGETPEQVACQQYSGPDKDGLRRQMGFLLQEPFYVQVLAEADGSGAPVLAPPCSPHQERQRGNSAPGTPSTPQSPLL